MELFWVYPAVALGALIVLSAFFSSSETALIGSGRVKLTHLAEGGDRGAKRAVEMIRQPGTVLATILLGNNLVNVTAASVATVLWGPVWATIVITPLLLVFAEITPKTVAASAPERFAARVAGPVQVIGWVLKPLTWAVTLFTDLLLRPILGPKYDSSRGLSRQELFTALRIGARDGELEPSETRMTREVLGLKDTPVRDIMIPLVYVEAIPESATYDKVLGTIARTTNTRYPVYHENLEDMVGMLLVKDLLVHWKTARENWRRHVRPLMRCRDSLEADELLRDMQIQGQHMAAVEDAQGRFVGIVTMEDILEEIVGEIQDEMDEDEIDLVREVSSGRYVVHGNIEVDDLCKVINIDLGHLDQHITLRQWFEKRCMATTMPKRRLRVGSARVIHRGGSRFEILVKSQLLGLDDPPPESAPAPPEIE
ncbi:MAG: hemolysin family protein [bacterium]